MNDAMGLVAGGSLPSRRRAFPVAEGESPCMEPGPDCGDAGDVGFEVEEGGGGGDAAAPPGLWPPQDARLGGPVALPSAEAHLVNEAIMAVRGRAVLGPGASSSDPVPLRPGSPLVIYPSGESGAFD